MLNSLSDVAVLHGDLDRAVALGEEALDVARRRNDRWSIASCYGALARIGQLQGDRDRAASIAHESLSLLRTIGSKPPIAMNLILLAWVARVDGMADRAGRLLGAAEAIRETTSWRINPTRRAEAEAEAALLRDQLGQQAFEIVWNEGRALSPDAAVKYALQEIDLD